VSLDRDLSQALSRMRRNPTSEADLEIPYLPAGLLVRRHVRSILAAAKVAGAEVVYEEQRGWLNSVFAIRLRGESRQLEYPVARLMDLLRSAGLDD